MRIPNFSDAAVTKYLTDLARQTDEAAKQYLFKDTANNSVLLQSPSGVVFEITVDDTGEITVTPISGTPDAPVIPPTPPTPQYRNFIINGGMQVSQENGSTAGTTTNYYPVDMFAVNFTTTGTLATKQVASRTPGGSPNRLRVTVTAADTSIVATESVYIRYALEGYRVADLGFGTSSAKTFTVQFGVKAPAGTYCVGLFNTPTNRYYTAEYVISAGEANTDVVKSVTVPGDTTGTWATDNTAGLYVFWPLATGSNFNGGTAGAWAVNSASTIATSNQFNLMGTNGNVFELFDVGLYEGSVAPAFQLPDYATELALCQRYFEVSDKVATTPLATGYTYNTSVAMGQYVFKVPKRAVPTFTALGAGSDYSVYRSGANNATDTLPTMDSASTLSAHVRHTHSTAPFTAGQGCHLYTATANAQYKFNARL